MHPSLRALRHRPWPLPAAPWLLRMEWLDLAFIHTPIAAAVLRPFVPPDLRIDEFGGHAWLGVVPFRMAHVTPRPLPNLPFLTTFPEVNLRTYVEVGGKPGVWFFSLDADSWPTVFGGRRFFHLPYHSARMRLVAREGWHYCASARRGGHAVFRGRYRPRGDVFFSTPGTFVHWATERYCLYSHSPRTGLSRAEVHHAPWPLQSAEVELEADSLAAAAGLATGAPPPVCHFSAGVSVVAFGRQSV